MKYKNIVTFGDLIDVYDQKKERDIKTSTKITNENTKKKVEKWLDLKLSEITTELVEEEILNPIYESLSVEYTNKIRTYINKIFNWAIKEEVVVSNPISNISEYKNPDEIKQNLIYYSPDEWKIIYSGFENLVDKKPKDYPYLVIISILYYMGIRGGEALALRKSDIIDNEYIIINKTCTFCTKKNRRKGI